MQRRRMRLVIDRRMAFDRRVRCQPCFEFRLAPAVGTAARCYGSRPDDTTRTRGSNLRMPTTSRPSRWLSATTTPSPGIARSRAKSPSQRAMSSQSSSAGFAAPRPRPARGHGSGRASGQQRSLASPCLVLRPETRQAVSCAAGGPSLCRSGPWAPRRQPPMRQRRGAPRFENFA